MMARSKKGCRASIGDAIVSENGQKVTQLRHSETDKTSFWGFKSENNGANRQFAPLIDISLAKIGSGLE